MVDHRRTPSQRSYQLPGWFFVLTAVLSVAAIGAVVWVFVGDRFDETPAALRPSATSSPTEPEPGPAASRPTSGSTADEDDGEGGEKPAAERPDIDVVVLNASRTPRLARGVADAAEKAGWTVAEVGNWVYPAVVNAVYHPEGRQAEAQQLADDVGVESVRPARPGMSSDALTVLLVSSP